jgi:hypothetical protein
MNETTLLDAACSLFILAFYAVNIRLTGKYKMYYLYPSGGWLTPLGVKDGRY